VLLAVVFALGFVVFGVGSGSNGISDALQSAFNFGGGGGTSISKAQKKANAHPADANAWRDLASAYETKQQPQGAVDALKRYVALRPKDTSGLQELAAEQTQLATQVYNQLTAQESVAAVSVPAATFAPASTSPLGKAFANQDPVQSALQSAANTSLGSLQQKLVAAEQQTESTYSRLVQLDPTDANSQLLLGQSAQTAGDTGTAVKAYKAFLKLAPDDPDASQVRSQLKSLTGSTATGSASSG
jgi:cytochrome c-type biogenesis protein CcmH/NrfG